MGEDTRTPHCFRTKQVSPQARTERSCRADSASHMRREKRYGRSVESRLASLRASLIMAGERSAGSSRTLIT